MTTANACCKHCETAGLTWTPFQTVGTHAKPAAEGSRTWRLLDVAGKAHLCPTAAPDVKAKAGRRPRP